MSDVDVMQERIRQYREAHRAAPPDLDFNLLNAILKLMNEESAVKVARNPLDADRNWDPTVPSHNVSSVFVDDQGRLTFRLRRDNEECSVGKVCDQIGRLRKQAPGGTSKVMVQISDTKTRQITDAYSHALVRDTWAGLPFDLVLAYYEES